MKRYISRRAFILACSIGVMAHTPFSGTLLVSGGPCGSTYVGPGDIVSGAGGFWGIRAYTRAYGQAAGAAFDLRRASDNAELTFNFLCTGELDLAAINTWAGGSNIFVHRAYDQSGNGANYNNATQAQQPQFFTSGGAGNHPYLQSDTDVSHALSGNAPPTVSGVVSLTTVANRSSGTGQVRFMTQNGQSGNRLEATSGVSNQWKLSPGVVGGVGSITKTASDGSWHDGQGIINGASSVIVIDGATSTGSITGATNSSNQITVAGDTSTTVKESEGGWWNNIVFSPTNYADMSANQHAYYGF